MELSRNDTAILMKDGKEKKVADLTEKDLPNIQLSGKIRNGKATSVPMKRAELKKDKDVSLERRVFMYGDMKIPVMYDLQVPLTLEKATSLYGKEHVLDLFVTQLRVDEDHARTVKGGTRKVSPELRAKAEAIEKLPANKKVLVDKLLAGEALTAVELKAVSTK